jgi:CRISPR-associated endoribonuclease Cas6
VILYNHPAKNDSWRWALIRLYLIADSGRQPRFQLPWNYHLSFVSFLYDALNKYEPELATELHQHEHAPPFSFSEFIQTGPYQAMDDGLSCERGYWVVNSDDDRILDAIANHARHHELKLRHTEVPIEGVELEPIEGVTEAKYRTVSPIYVSKRDKNGEREGLLPSDGMWFNNLIDNVRNRMEAVSGESPSNFVIEDVDWWKQKRLRVADSGWVQCARTGLRIRTDEQTSAFIQQQGIGERSGLGFGCVMPVEAIPAEWR